ncbi:DapH/DapD/GlmU-related protein [Planctomycetota bacterium]
MSFLKSEGFLIGDVPYREVQLCGFSRISDPIPQTVTWFEGTSVEVRRLKSVIVLCGDEFSIPKSSDGLFVPVKEPRRAFAKSVARFGVLDAAKAFGIAQTARIANDCTIGWGSSVGEYSVIEAGVTIGTSTRIGDHVCIKSGTLIGDHCLIRSGVVIGGVGFGFTKAPDGTWERFPHIGSVVIENHVEIGANTVIDRSVLGKSVIRRGTKIDSLVYIAHNAEIGPDNIVAANATLAGSVSTGRGVWIGLASSIREGCRIGDEVYIGMGTVVISSVDARKKVVGVPGRVIGRSD